MSPQCAIFLLLSLQCSSLITAQISTIDDDDLAAGSGHGAGDSFIISTSTSVRPPLSSSSSTTTPRSTTTRWTPFSSSTTAAALVTSTARESVVSLNRSTATAAARPLFGEHVEDAVGPVLSPSRAASYGVDETSGSGFGTGDEEMDDSDLVGGGGGGERDSQESAYDDDDEYYYDGDYDDYYNYTDSYDEDGDNSSSYDDSDGDDLSRTAAEGGRYQPGVDSYSPVPPVENDSDGNHGNSSLSNQPAVVGVDENIVGKDSDDVTVIGRDDGTETPSFDLDDDDDDESDDSTGHRHNSDGLDTEAVDRHTSFFAQPGILAAIVGGAIVGLLCAILLVMLVVYRMRKKDEGSYVLDEPKRSLTGNGYSKNYNNKEFYA